MSTHISGRLKSPACNPENLDVSDSLIKFEAPPAAYPREDLSPDAVSQDSSKLPRLCEEQLSPLTPLAPH